jgi:mannose-1-phosphate guanylyltransferase
LAAEQLPDIPAANLIGEPARRDLAAAVGLAMCHVARRDEDAPVAILWGDNYMNDVPTFLGVMAAAEQMLRAGEAQILFVGETPRFANENLGWIGLGEEVGAVDGPPTYRFDSFAYRPPLETCQQWLAAGTHVWNTGYFVTTPRYIRGLYARHQPAMWARLETIVAHIGLDDYKQVLHAEYPQLASLSFDDAILSHMPHDDALVLHGRMGWSDPGTLYALKEAINSDPEANVTQGLVVAPDSSDSLLYNYEEGKLLAAVGLEGMIVVNTGEAILVVHKDKIPLVKQLVNSLVGTDLEKYT